MSLFSISDLHLSLASPKPMDVFGRRWADHTERLEKNWRAVVKETDTVVLPGDISWAMKLEEAEADLTFIDSLPGHKLIGKGNHDYWWTTLSKMESALKRWDLHSISFLHNNAYAAEEHIICGSRGWFVDEALHGRAVTNNADFDKLSARETLRLRASLGAGRAMRDVYGELPYLVYLHFPPVFGDTVCRPIIELLHEFGVRRCFYGHLHGNYTLPRRSFFEDIELTIIAADHLEFVPYLTHKG